MPLRVGIVSAAHLHVNSYVACFGAHPDAELVGVWDDHTERGTRWATEKSVRWFERYEELLESVDAVAICSENRKHAEFVEKASAAGKHILCEKPLVTSEAEADQMTAAVRASGVRFMTAFPCRFAASWPKLKSEVQSGAIGTVRAISATNRGRCPFGWFVDVEQSGGGAMIDHVVHVADLLQDLLGSTPVRVQAQIGSNMYGESWDDTAMVTLEYPGGVFATLDSSWSRPRGFRTWGDVTMNVVGDRGVIELDMFGRHVYATRADGMSADGVGGNPDAGMVNEFVRACLDDREPSVTLELGLAAARVAIAGYRSVREGEPVAL